MIENRRALHQLLKSLCCWIRFLAPDQQVDAPHLRQIRYRIHQPHLADETSHSDEHHMLARQSGTKGERTGCPDAIEMNNGERPFRCLTLSRTYCRCQGFHTGQIQIVRQLLPRPPSIRTSSSNTCKQSSRTNNRFKQTSCCYAISKFHPFHDQPLYPRMLGHSLHHVIPPLLSQS